MPSPLLQLPPELIHAILARVDVPTLARWLAMLCPDAYLERDFVAKRSRTGELFLRAIAVDAHRNTVARFRHMHVKRCACSWRPHPPLFGSLSCIQCLCCDVFWALPKDITDAQLSSVVCTMMGLAGLPQSVCERVFRAGMHFMARAEECTQHTGSLGPHLIVLYRGSVYPHVYPRRGDIESSLVIWVSGDLPPDTHIHNSVIINTNQQHKPPVMSSDTTMSGCFYFLFTLN